MDISEFMPIPSEFARLIEADARFVVAFPRSGSRWLTRLLADLLNQSNGVDTSEIYRDLHQYETGEPQRRTFTGWHFDEVAPDTHHPPRRSVLSGLGMRPLFRSHNLSFLLERPQHRFIYVYRWAPAMLVSYHSYAVKEGFVSSDTSFESFCEWALEMWVRHVGAAVEAHQRHPDRVLFVKYGDASPFNEAQLSACADFLAFPADPGMVRRSLDNLRGFLNELTSSPHATHPRGTNTSVAGSLPPALLAGLERRTRFVLERADRIAEEQSNACRPKQAGNGHLE